MLNRQLRRLFWRGSVCRRRWSRVWPEPRVLWEPSWWLSWSSSYDEECSVALGSGLRFSGVYSRVWKNAGPAFPFLSSWAVGPWLVGRLFQGFLYSQQRLLASLPASSLRRAKTTQFPIRLCWFRTMTTTSAPLPNLTRQQSSQFQCECEERARLFTCHRSWHNLEWRFLLHNHSVRSGIPK